MRVAIFTVVLGLVCSVPARGQEVQRRWPAPERPSPELFAHDAGTDAVGRVRFLPEAGEADGTLWLRGALVGAGVGAILGGVAALFPASVMSDGDPGYLSEYTLSWGGIGLLIGGVLGAAVGNEYDRGGE